MGGGASRGLDLLVVRVAVVRLELGAAAERGAALAQVVALARPFAAAAAADGADAGVALVAGRVHLVHERVVVAEVLTGGGCDFGRRRTWRQQPWRRNRHGDRLGRKERLFYVS